MLSLHWNVSWRLLASLKDKDDNKSHEEDRSQQYANLTGNMFQISDSASSPLDLKI